MANFFGGYDYSVDAKGRVNIPAKFRKALSPEADETFFVVRAPDKCLRAYPKDVWDKRVEKINALPEIPQNLRLKQLLFSNLCESSIDAQGRIMLTSALMEFAGITKEVKVIGMSDYMELWNPAKYAEHIGTGQDFDEAFYAVETALAGL